MCELCRLATMQCDSREDVSSLKTTFFSKFQEFFSLGRIAIAWAGLASALPWMHWKSEAFAF
jgi:hypothetical protein